MCLYFFMFSNFNYEFVVNIYSFYCKIKILYSKFGIIDFNCIQWLVCNFVKNLWFFMYVGLNN